MSLTGSAKRINRAVYAMAPKRFWAVLLATAVVVLLVYLAWLVVLGWYLLFGVVLIPFRLSRRWRMRSEVDALRHRKIVEAIRGSGMDGENPQ